MRIKWTPDALVDLDRVGDFLAPVAPDAAQKLRKTLQIAPDRLLDFPRMGERVENLGDEEVRRLVIGNYELRYDVRADLIRVLRIFHHREDR